MSCLRSLRRGSLLGLAVAVLASPLWAQDAHRRQGWTVDGGGGLAIPTGTFSDYVDPGPSAALRVAYWLSPRVAIELGGAADLMDGQAVAPDRRLPDLKLFHYSLGVAADLLPPDEKVSVLTKVGFGVTRLDSDTFQIGRLPASDMSEDYFTAQGGLKVAYDLFDRVGLFVEGQARWVQAQSKDFLPLEAFDPQNLRPLDDVVVIPVQLGLEVAL